MTMAHTRMPFIEYKQFVVNKNRDKEMGNKAQWGCRYIITKS